MMLLLMVDIVVVVVVTGEVIDVGQSYMMFLHPDLMCFTTNFLRVAGLTFFICTEMHDA